MCYVNVYLLLIVHILSLSDATIGFHGSGTNVQNLTLSFFVILQKRLYTLHSLNITNACWTET